MLPVNLYSFRRKVSYHKKAFKRFLGKVERKPPADLHTIIDEVSLEVWGETDCLSCANCCKTMTPTFRHKDVLRIAAYLGMRPKDFREKWLYLEKKDKDWMNTTRPCQFLDKTTNMCSIYEVRPEDCAGFPHLTKKNVTDYIHVHQQNIEYCPATYKMVEKMMERMG